MQAIAELGVSPAVARKESSRWRLTLLAAGALTLLGGAAAWLWAGQQVLAELREELAGHAPEELRLAAVVRNAVTEAQLLELEAVVQAW